MDEKKREWGEYYYQNKRGSKKSWALEIVHNVNQLIPSFNEIFDELHAAVKLLSYEDVVVESPTGSGKTLAFLLPALTIMNKRPKWKKEEIGLLVICPSRDLALQIHGVASPYTDALGYTTMAAVGGKNIQGDMKKITNGVNVLVATPGRLERLIDLDKDGRLRRMLKSVEVLVVDEADKFIEQSFSKSLSTILPVLPKQRRTGLFSATQVRDSLDLNMFALRSPAFIKVAESKLATPSSLHAFYTECTAELKLITLIEFIRSIPTQKVLVFLPSSQCVRYFALVVPRLLKKRTVLAVEGKNKKGRFSTVEKLRKSNNCVMLCTDVLARGIDVSDLDWVVQFDVPKKTSWVVHRSGRCARNGREGSSLLMLTPQQSAYVQFISKYEKIEMKRKSVPTVTDRKAEELRQKIVRMAAADRLILEKGTSAFISYVKALRTHDSKVVCRSKELDITGMAHAFGLLRLPKIQEVFDADTKAFKRSDVDTSTIPYTSKAVEQRHAQLKEKRRARREMMEKAAGKHKGNRVKQGANGKENRKRKPEEGHKKPSNGEAPKKKKKKLDV